MPTKDYQGQNIIAQMTARLMPPNDSYPDCECILVLTKQHLYILEDNFDGTYETHFEFVLNEIDNIGLAGDEPAFISKDGVNTTLKSFISSLLLFVCGWITIPSRQGSTAGKYMIIHYHTEQGTKDRIDFTMYSPETKGFLAAFHKLRFP